MSVVVLGSSHQHQRYRLLIMTFPTAAAAAAKYSPTFLLVAGMYITGSLVNHFPASEHVKVGVDLPCPDLSSYAAASFNHTLLRDGLVVAAASLLSAVPILLAPSGHSTDAKIKSIASLFTGQSVTLGSSETLRHFLVRPDKNFYKLCNLSTEDCNRLSNLVLPVWKMANDSESLCQSTTPSDSDHFALTQSLHALPNSTMGLLGAALIMFVLNLGKWTRPSTRPASLKTSFKKTPFNVKLTFVLAFATILCFILYYQYKSVQWHFAETFVSLVYGCFLQLSCSMLMTTSDHQPPAAEPLPHKNDDVPSVGANV